MALNKTKFKLLAKSLSIEPQPYKAALNLVAIELNISTTGQSEKRDSFFKNLPHTADIKPTTLLSQKQWTKNISELPDVPDSAVTKYLLNTSIINNGTARRYKTSRSYQLKEHVHSVYILPGAMDNIVAIKGKCNPSQSSNQDDVKIMIALVDDVDGTPRGGYCSCTAG